MRKRGNNMLSIKSNFGIFKDRQGRAYADDDLNKLCKTLIRSDCVNFNVKKVGGGFNSAIADRIFNKIETKDENAKILIFNDFSLQMLDKLIDEGFKRDNIYLAYGSWNKDGTPSDDDRVLKIMKLYIKSNFVGDFNVISLKEAFENMKFDIIIANPPYGSIGADITKEILDGIDFDEYINLLPIKDICRIADLVNHVISAESIDRGIAFEDAAVTTAISTLSKTKANDMSPDEFLVGKQTKDDSPLYKYVTENFLRKYDRFTQRTNCSLDDLKRKHLGEGPTDVGILVSHRESSHGHLPYSKSSPQYRWNVLRDMPPEELVTIWSPRMQNNKTHGILILLPTKRERDNLADFLYSEDGFRFLSMQFDAMNSDFAQYWNVFPKVDWTHPWTVEEILREYDYTDSEIEEVMEGLKNYKGMNE